MALKHRFFWTWDHSMDWVPLATGLQEFGSYNPYFKKSEVFIQDYKCLIDFSARHQFTGIIIYGFLRDIHGGVEAAQEVCRYGREKGVRVMPGIGVNSYSGVYWEGDHQFNLDKWLQKHPHLEAQGEAYRGSPYSKNPYLRLACPSQKANRQWMEDAVRWLTETFDIGGINFETGDYGLCGCPECSKLSSRQQAWSLNDMAELLPPLIETALSVKSDLLPVCECYFDQVLDPEIHSPLRTLPREAILQFCINSQYLGRFLKELTPEICAQLPPHEKIIRTHIGSQWNDDGRHLFTGQQYAAIIKTIAAAGFDGITIFGEASELYMVNKINYLTVASFAANPMLSWPAFEQNHLAPLLGGPVEVSKYVELLGKPRISEADVQSAMATMKDTVEPFQKAWAWLVWHLSQRRSAQEPW